jgi:hypothetical protein
MKKILFTAVLCLFTLFVEAQENKFAANRSENAVGTHHLSNGNFRCRRRVYTTNIV